MLLSKSVNNIQSISIKIIETIFRLFLLTEFPCNLQTRKQIIASCILFFVLIFLLFPSLLPGKLDTRVGKLNTHIYNKAL